MHTPHSLNRRQFLRNAGGSAVSLAVIKPGSVWSSQANSRIRLGLIGCGGRGVWIADLFKEHGGYEITALADYFPEKTLAAGEKFSIPAKRQFTGLSAFRKLLDSRTVDAVAIETPPYFHPIHAQAAVEAGVHVFLSKPIAVDVAGCDTVAESARKAAQRNLVFLVDFQTRTDPFYREAVKRVHYGEIGQVVCAEAAYHAGPTWDKQSEYLKKQPVSPEDRLRAWGLDRVLSGDVITEQNIHAIDVATWALDAHPEHAVGTGGRYRKYGTCWDHFSVLYQFPQEVELTFHSKQLGLGQDDILCRIYGSEGTLDSDYFGSVSIRGNLPYKGGEVVNLYQRGAVSNIDDFHQTVMDGRSANTTVAPSVVSNLTTILGRMAAYRQAKVTWEEMLSTAEKFEPDLSGLNP
ncbi:MAG: Inositol 2-dehydrogenase [bacterium ADurb.Bin478]|nr:MAG: Inositol 2-dehydrogenase [bacterium ADurb.Bin478]